MQRQNKNQYYYDDSSDEEDSNQKIKLFDNMVENQWKQCKKNLSHQKTVNTIHEHSQLNNKDELINHYFYCSFILTSAGIQLLYQPEVNAIYYQNKNKELAFSLPDEMQPNDYEQLATFLLTTTLEQLIPPLCDTFLRADTAGTALDAHTIAAIEDFVILQVLKNHALKLAAIFAEQPTMIAQYFYNKEQSLPFLSILSDTVANIMIKYIKKKAIPYRAEQPIARLFDPDNDNIVNAFTNEALSKAIAELNNLGVIYAENDHWLRKSIEDFPKKSPFPRNYAGHFKKTAQLAHTRVKNLRGKGANIKGTAGLSIDIQNHSLQKAYLEDLFDNKNEAEQKNIILPLLKTHPAMLQFLALNHQYFSTIIKNRFSKAFLKHLIADKSFLPRKTLATGFTFSATHALEFFAQLRLSNRSQRREIRNLSQDPTITKIHQTIADANPHNQSMVSKLNQRSWHFGRFFKATESQKILHSSLGRSDYVDAMGNYQAVYATIKALKKQLNIDDGQIALWIRDCLNARELSYPAQKSILFQHRQSIQHYLAAITYLMFGCEATRHPSSLLTGQMLLDLIIAKQADISWKKALTENKDGGLFPMSPDNAVSAARFLHQLYADYLPYRYHYEGLANPAQAWGIISRETKIFTTWLNWKMPHIDSLKEQKINEIYNFILKTAMTEWYFVTKAPTHALQV